jgi:ATP-dependent DNA helicase UvrD/PcrA
MSPFAAIDSPADLRRVMNAAFEVSDEQWAAIQAPLEPSVVVAGAGSGKTTLMAARVVYLVATGAVAPDEVLGLTFTTKAAAELRGRIRDALAAAGHGRGAALDPDEELAEPTVATYNAYAAGLLTEHGLRIGHEPDTRVMADASRYQLAARAIARHRGEVLLLSDSPQHVIDWMLALEGAMSEHLVDEDEVRGFTLKARAAFEAELARSDTQKQRDLVAAQDKRLELLGLVRTYRGLKAELGLMDFSDQIALAARLAVEQPEVGQAERDRYRVVLLDEYQDTSVAQARMLAHLFSGPDPEHGRGHPVTAVGDPNQAIYGWRGASVSNILGFGHDFPAADGRTDVPALPLSTNRRSDSRILEVANRLAEPLYRDFPQTARLRARSDAAAGDVHAMVHATYDEELEWLAREVADCHAAMSEPLWREIGVLTRDNSHAADVFDALSRAEIPVEIVGLSGLLRLPEVSEVVSTLALLNDLTANADLLNLLTGPRWAVGPRDLALLGKRARELAGASGRATERLDLHEALQAAVAGADPTEVVALSDALADPGDLPYSPAARERFTLLARELRNLRAHTGETLLDLVRRIIDTCGIDVELDASVSPAARARRENLDLFVKAVAEFQSIDGAATLPALLAYLNAEDELGNGLDIATPSEADSVKLLTVHRAKGLEWDAVFVVGVCQERFPSTVPRSRWPKGHAVLPTPLRGDAADLPRLDGWTAKDVETLASQSRAHDGVEELRLGYVAFTRARHRLSVSSHVWRHGRKKPVGPSSFQQVVREQLVSWGGDADQWLEPVDGESNPLLDGHRSVPWPVTEQTAEALRRIEAAELVREAADSANQGANYEAGDPDLDLVDASLVAEWDAEIERLLAEAAADTADVVDVPLPSSLSATTLARLRQDRDGLAHELVRPMPRRPSPAARFGTRFHAWVEARFGQQQLVDPDELPGRADTGIDDEDDLRELIQVFEKGEFAERTPVAVEPPFALVLAGQVVRGRIDAVYADNDSSVDGADGYLVVDWKTNREQTADPLQLAVYRVAWAELAGVPVERVRAAFYYVRTGELVEPPDLEPRQQLEELLVPDGPT